MLAAVAVMETAHIWPSDRSRLLTWEAEMVSDRLLKVCFNLRDEYSSHGLIKRCPVHVDGCSDREDEAAHPGVHVVLGLQQVDGHRQRGAAGSRPEGRGDGVCHVGDKSERQGSGYQREY